MNLHLHLIPRQAAIAAGLRHYFSGKPCANGHLTERQVGNKNCTGCRIERDRIRCAKPDVKAKRADYDRKRWSDDRDYLVEKNKRYYAENSHAVNAQKRGYYELNKEKLGLAREEWVKKNRSVIRYLNKKREKRIAIATPPWANHAAIKAIYDQAAEMSESTGVKHHVDHIVPLAGKLVCGLHVEWNLRPLPWLENISKGHRFIEELALAS